MFNGGLVFCEGVLTGVREGLGCFSGDLVFCGDILTAMGGADISVVVWDFVETFSRLWYLGVSVVVWRFVETF